jgi:hypothetical protein
VVAPVAHGLEDFAEAFVVADVVGDDEGLAHDEIPGEGFNEQCGRSLDRLDVRGRARG